MKDLGYQINYRIYLRVDGCHFASIFFSRLQGTHRTMTINAYPRYCTHYQTTSVGVHKKKKKEMIIRKQYKKLRYRSGDTFNIVRTAIVCVHISSPRL